MATQDSLYKKHLPYLLLTAHELRLLYAATYSCVSWMHFWLIFKAVAVGKFEEVQKYDASLLFNNCFNLFLVAVLLTSEKYKNNRMSDFHEHE